MGVPVCVPTLKDSCVSRSTACASMNGQTRARSVSYAQAAHVLCVICSLMDFPCCEATPLSDRGVLNRMRSNITSYNISMRSSYSHARSLEHH